MKNKFACSHPGCLFRNRRVGAENACDYATVTGKTRTRRGKTLNNAKCSYYVPKGDIKLYRGPNLTGPIWEPYALGMHRAGMPTRKIARILRESQSSITRCVKRYEVPKEQRPKVSLSKYDWKRAELLYKQGASDRQIAAALGCTPFRVQQWRVDFMLPMDTDPNKEAEK